MLFVFFDIIEHSNLKNKFNSRVNRLYTSKSHVKASDLKEISFETIMNGADDSLSTANDESMGIFQQSSSVIRSVGVTLRNKLFGNDIKKIADLTSPNQIYSFLLYEEDKNIKTVLKLILIGMDIWEKMEKPASQEQSLHTIGGVKQRVTVYRKLLEGINIFKIVKDIYRDLSYHIDTEPAVTYFYINEVETNFKTLYNDVHTLVETNFSNKDMVTYLTKLIDTVNTYKKMDDAVFQKGGGSRRFSNRK